MSSLTPLRFKKNVIRTRPRAVHFRGKLKGARAKSSTWDKELKTAPHGEGEETRMNAANARLNSLLWRPGPEKAEKPFALGRMDVAEQPDNVPRKLQGSMWGRSRLIERHVS
jgi:hypothetical protein